MKTEVEDPQTNPPQEQPVPEAEERDIKPSENNAKVIVLFPYRVTNVFAQLALKYYVNSFPHEVMIRKMSLIGETRARAISQTFHWRSRLPYNR